MALPNANVLGNAATTTADFQTAIEAQRQYLDDLDFSTLPGTITAGMVPDIQDLNGAATASQVPNIEDLNGSFPVGALGHDAAPTYHVRAGTRYMVDGTTGVMSNFSLDSETESVMHDIGVAQWSELSRVSATAKAVILQIKIRIPNGGSTVSAIVSSAAPGISITPNEDNAVAGCAGDGSGYAHFIFQVEVPCSSNAIKMGWFKYGSSTPDIDLKYRGYIEG